MKKLLMIVGMTGMIALVSAGTRAGAAVPTTTSGDAPPGVASCNAHACYVECVAEGCETGECVPEQTRPGFYCQCYNATGKCE